MKPNNGDIAALEKNICPACGKEFLTRNILITQNLNKLFQEKYITTGFSLCEDCINKAKENNGVWLCEIIESKNCYSIGRSFLLKMKAIEKLPEEIKNRAENEHWLAIDSKGADRLSWEMDGE